MEKCSRNFPSLAPGEIECQRSDWTAPANPAAIPDSKIQAAHAIGSITDIGENGSAPAGRNPVIVFNGAGSHHPATDHSLTFVYT